MKQIVIEIICVLFMILFIYTGISKLIEFSVFKEQLRDTPFKSFASFIALALPIVEIIVALMLLIPNWRMKGLYLSFFLMGGFTIYVIALVSFAQELPCSCGGVLEQLSWPQHIVFNSVFLGLAALGIWLNKRSQKDTNNLNKTIVSI